MGTRFDFAGIQSAEATSERLYEARKAAVQKDAVVEIEDMSLAAYVKDKFSEFERNRRESGVEDQMLDNLRRINSEYSQAKLDAIQGSVGGSEVFIGVTELKHRAAVAWLLEIFSNEEDKPWGLRPTPEPSVSMYDVQQAMMGVQDIAQRRLAQAQQEGVELKPDEIASIQKEMRTAADQRIRQIAIEKASNLEERVNDQFLEGHLWEIFEDFVSDLVSMKAGILKGPVLQTLTRKRWDIDPTTGVPDLKLQKEVQPIFERVDPFNAYPDPATVDFEGDFIERVKFFKADLQKMKGFKGYDSTAIDSVLINFGSVPTLLSTNLDQELEDLRDTGDEDDNTANTNLIHKSTVEGYEAHLSMSGSQCMTYGLTKKEVDPLSQFQVVVLLVGDQIIYKGYEPDLLGRKPYSKAGFGHISGSFWYKGLPEVLKDVQDTANATARALVNNLAIASGPQAIFSDVGRLAQGERVTSIYPFKVWQFTNKQTSTAPPLDFLQPRSIARELLEVLGYFTKSADDISGIPAYTYGNEKVAGAGRTFGGLSMLMSNATKGIKKVVLTIDRKVFKPMIDRVIDWNFSKKNDMSIVGDVNIVSTGVVALMAKEQVAERRLSYLRDTANPVDSQILGLTGRAALHREIVKTLEISGSTIIPSDEVIEERQREERESQQAQQRQAQMQMQMEQQVQQADVQSQQRGDQREDAKVQISAAKTEGEMQLKREELKIKGMLASQKGIETGAKAGMLEAQTMDTIIGGNGVENDSGI